MRPRLGFLLALLAIPTLALADPGNGIDLSWNDCLGGPTASLNRNFACAGPTDESYDLLFQFKVSQDVPNLVSLTAHIDLWDDWGDLKPFWHYESGGCQRSGGPDPDGIEIASAMPPGCVAAGTVDAWEGNGVATIVQVTPLNGAAASLTLQVARSTGSSALVAGYNYYAFHLTFNTRNRAVCDGCGDPAHICWRSATLRSNDGSPSIELSGWDKFIDAATINGGGASSETCTGLSTRGRTWGLLKALYR